MQLKSGSEYSEDVTADTKPEVKARDGAEKEGLCCNCLKLEKEKKTLSHQVEKMPKLLNLRDAEILLLKDA